MSQTALMDSPQRTGVTCTPADSDDETWNETTPWQPPPDNRCSGRLGYLLVCIFTITSCVTSSALWIHLPVATKLPKQSDRLPLKLLAVQEVASVTPLLYFFVRRYCPGKPHEVPFLYAIFTVGISCCLLLGLFWREHTFIAHAHAESVTYLCLALLLSCSSLCFPLVFFPFLATLSPRYVTAYFIGDGLGCLLPHLVAITQGIHNISDCFHQLQFKDTRPHHDGKANGLLNAKTNPEPSIYKLLGVNNTKHVMSTEPPLSVDEVLTTGDVYFYYISALVALCAIAFTLFRYLPYFENQFITDTPVVHGLVSFSNATGGYVTNTNRKVPNIHQNQAKSRDTWPHRYHDYTREEVNHYGRENHPVMKNQEAPGDFNTATAAPSTGVLPHYENQILNDIRTPQTHASSATAASSNTSTNCLNWRDNPSLLTPPPAHEVDTMPTTTRVGNSGATNRTTATRGTSGTQRILSRQPNSGKQKNKHTLLLLLITGWTSILLQGPLSSAKAYADLPSNNNYFILGVILTNSVAPVCCALAFKFPPRSRVTIIVALTALGTILLTYFLALMGFSQAAGEGSPMAGNAGELLAVIAWLAISGLFSYTRVTIATIFRNEGTRSLLWFAACMTLGSALGTLALINNFSISLVFKKYLGCPKIKN